MEKWVVRQSRRSFYREPVFSWQVFFFFFEVGGGRNLLLPRLFSYPALKNAPNEIYSSVFYYI